MENIEKILLFTPLILGYLTSFFCKIGKKSGENVKFRPKPWVFGIAWPILYLCLGYSWVLSRKKDQKTDIFYGITTALLTLWLVVYGCQKDKKGGVYVLIATFTSLLACFTIGTQRSKLLLTPLIGWILLATLMNTFEISK